MSVYMEKDYVMSVAETAKQQLFGMTRTSVLMSWGISGLYATEFKDMPALKLKVNGRLFKGFVVIALNGSDYYEVYLTNDTETRLVSDEVCFDELGELIDRHIERGDNQEEYDKFCNSQLTKLVTG